MSENTQTEIKPELAPLNALAGCWDVEGMTNDGRTVRIQAVDTYEWLPGGYSMLHRTEAHIAENYFESTEIIGYDAAQKAYVTRFFDTWGQTGSYTLTVDGSIWTLQRETERATMRVSDDGQTMAVHWDMSKNGTDWEPWMDLTFTRAGNA